MVVTMKTPLPTEEELSVQDVSIGSAYLKAGAHHLGKYCEPQNNEFMLCRQETDDIRKCVKDGKQVTSCSLEFFSKVRTIARFVRTILVYVLCTFPLR